MRKAYFFIIAFLMFANISVAQTYLWNGVDGTDYQDPLNWTPNRTIPGAADVLQFNAASPIIVNNVKNETIGAIQILSGTSSVTLSTNVGTNILTLSAAVPLIYSSAGSILAGDVLTIQLSNASSFTITSGIFGIAPSTGGKIAINGPLVVNGGTLDFDVAGTGGTTITSLGSITYNAGTFLCVTPSAITWAGGSNYNHAVNGSFASAIPASTWQTGSNCNISGMNSGTIAPTGFTNINFANLKWNCPAQQGNIDWLPAGSTLFVLGNLNIVITGSGTQELRVSTGDATIKTLDYTQNGGIFTLQAGALTTTLSVAGTFSQTAGFLNGASGSSPATATIDLKGNVTRSGGNWSSFNSNSGSQLIVQFSGSSAQTVTLGGSWNNPNGGRCNIVDINTDFASGINLTGTLKVHNQSSSTLPATFTMSGKKITGTGVVSYSSAAGTSGTTLIYSGIFDQTASVIEFPNSPANLNNLTINNPLGVSFPASFNRTILGTLTLQSGNLAIGSNTLELTNPSLVNQLAYTSGFITTGTLGRLFPATGLPTSQGDIGRFPFGAGVNDRSLYVFFSAASLSSGGLAGKIYVSHTPSTLVVPIFPYILDNTVLLDKRTSTKWDITTSVFTLGSGGETISLTAAAYNIGAVDDYTTLRLTDGLTAYGTGLMPNPNLGSNDKPVTGKLGLTMSDINKSIYIGSNGLAAFNPLVIITFTWTGASTSPSNSNWTNAGNWTSPNSTGYPSASTEIAIINIASPPFQPTINGSDNISVYQLTVGSSNMLTMVGGAKLTVYDDIPDFSGGKVFDPLSKFGYASSNNPQTILDLPYGNLEVAGTGAKTFANFVTVRGSYTWSGYPPIIFPSSTFTYAGTGAQTITAGNYYNLIITNPRAGALITLGNASSPNTIDVYNNFDPSGLNGDYTIFYPYNTFNFSNPGAQNIPGFKYYLMTNSALTRTLDPLGSAQPAHVISCLSLSCPGSFTVDGSKVKYIVTGFSNPTLFTGGKYYDLEIGAGNAAGLNGNELDFFNSARVSVAGTFTLSLTNFKQGKNIYAFDFNGTTDQTITAFKTNTATNTPAFKYPNVKIAGGNRNVTFGGAGTDTIAITGKLTQEINAELGTPIPFAANKGFIVAGSTVTFSVASDDIPVLKPAIAGGNNYYNLSVNGGTRYLGGDMIIGGNLAVSGNDVSVGVLNVGNGSSARVLTVLGNILDSGKVAGSVPTAQIDMNTGTLGSTTINLKGNLKIKDYGQLMGTTSDNAKNGLIIFNGSAKQTYTNTDLTFKNGLVNFVVGDGTNPSNLTLESSMNLLTSSATVPNRDTLIVTDKSSLDCSTFNITGNGANSAVFKLNAGATLITANTGGIEGVASGTSDGSITSGTTIVKTYDPLASYTFNAPSSTNTNFPAVTTPFPMSNLTFGNDVNAAIFTLNKYIDVSDTLKLRSNSTLAVGENYLNLKSTSTKTARIAAVPDNASITYGANGRFVVERYYPALRAWRLITAPITAEAGRTVFNSWQLGNKVASGSGVYVTGPAGGNGLDASPQNNFSLRTYDGTKFNGVSDTKNLLLSGSIGTPGVPDNFGMFQFVRGDRSGPALFNPFVTNTTTLRDTGKVQIHNQTFTLNNPSGGFNLVGNPFASPVDITSIMAGTANIDNSNFWVYDPRLNTQVGAYVTMTLLLSVWTPTPSSPGGQDKNIQSSQAFFVRKSSSSPAAMVFAETNKSAQNNLGIFREVLQPAMFRANLYLQETDTTILSDGILVAFDNAFDAAVDFGDAPKFINTKETFGLLRDTKNLAVEKRRPIVANDTLFFNLTRTTQRNYQFEFVPANMDISLTAFLEDNYTNTKTIVSLTSTSIFNFTINGDAASAAPDRFKIVFKASAGAPLPVTYKSIKAYQQGDNIAVDWTVENEINISKYEVEKSTDGVNFTKVNTTTAKGISGSIDYKFVDNNAVQGDNFYRILSYNQSGAFDYSRVVVVKLGKAGAGLSIYPNPVTGNTIGLAMTNMARGTYQIRLINTAGQTFMTKKLTHATGNSMETLTPDSKMSAGIYHLEITAPDKRISTIKVIVQ